MAMVSGRVMIRPSAMATREVDLLLRDIDHIGLAGGIEMGEIAHAAAPSSSDSKAFVLRDIILPHQALADEEGFDPHLAQAGDCRRA